MASTVYEREMRVPDTEVLRRTNFLGIIIIMRKAQRRWAGHVSRMPDKCVGKYFVIIIIFITIITIIVVVAVIIIIIMIMPDDRIPKQLLYRELC